MGVVGEGGVELVFVFSCLSFAFGLLCTHLQTTVYTCAHGSVVGFCDKGPSRSVDWDVYTRNSTVAQDSRKLYP